MKKKNQPTTLDAVRERTVPDMVVADEQENPKKKSRHILAKLLCLLAAAGVWMYVMNSETTAFERSFTQLPVVVDGVAELNAHSNMAVISGFGNTVDLTVSGKKSEVQDLLGEEIRIAVDVSGLTEAGKYDLPVQVILPGNLTVLNEDQLTAPVYVDVNTTREVPVKILNLDYVISTAYTMGEPELSQTTVKVTGPQQVLDLIDCAALDFNLGNVTTSTTMVGTPRLADADGVSVSNPYVRCDIREISVNIPVETTKELRLVAAYSVRELMNVWAAEITPATVIVRGDPMLLAELGDIKVYDISVGTGEGEYNVSNGVLDLPAGVTVEQLPEKITVSIRRIEG